MADSLPRLVSLIDMAEMLRVSPHTVRSWIRKGKLQPLRLCRRILFHPAEILRFLAEADYKKAADSQWAAQREVHRANAPTHSPKNP
jgi:excisionase family DNA binding protein